MEPEINTENYAGTYQFIKKRNWPANLKPLLSSYLHIFKRDDGKIFKASVLKRPEEGPPLPLDLFNTVINLLKPTAEYNKKWNSTIKKRWEREKKRSVLYNIEDHSFMETGKWHILVDQTLITQGQQRIREVNTRTLAFLNKLLVDNPSARLMFYPEGMMIFRNESFMRRIRYWNLEDGAIPIFEQDQRNDDGPTDEDIQYNDDDEETPYIDRVKNLVHFLERHQEILREVFPEIPNNDDYRIVLDDDPEYPDPIGVVAVDLGDANYNSYLPMFRFGRLGYVISVLSNITLPNFREGKSTFLLKFVNMYNDNAPAGMAAYDDPQLTGFTLADSPSKPMYPRRAKPPDEWMIDMVNPRIRVVGSNAVFLPFRGLQLYPPAQNPPREDYNVDHSLTTRMLVTMINLTFAKTKKYFRESNNPMLRLRGQDLSLYQVHFRFFSEEEGITWRVFPAVRLQFDENDPEERDMIADRLEQWIDNIRRPSMVDEDEEYEDYIPSDSVLDTSRFQFVIIPVPLRDEAGPITVRRHKRKIQRVAADEVDGPAIVGQTFFQRIRRLRELLDNGDTRFAMLADENANVPHLLRLNNYPSDDDDPDEYEEGDGGGTGNPDHHRFMIWETLLDTTTNRCVNNCLRACGYEGQLPDNQTIDGLIDLIKFHDLKIDIIYNVPKLDEKRFERPPRKFMTPGARKKSNFFPLDNTLVEPIYAYKTEDAEYCLVYDVDRRHVEVADTTMGLTLMDGIYASYHVIIKNTQTSTLIIRDYYDVGDIGKPEPVSSDRAYIFFDVETIADPDANDDCIPYSFSYIILKMDEIRDFCLLDSLAGPVDAEVNARVKNKTGFRCVIDSLQDIKDAIDSDDSCAQYYMIGFNNSRFDNFILLKEAYKTGIDRAVSYVAYYGETIGSIYLFSGKVRVWDMAKHLPGSLGELCDSFGLSSLRKKDGSISHIEVQDIFRRYPRDDFIQALDTHYGMNKIITYNNFDVAATIVIFNQYVKAWKTIPFAKDDSLGHPCSHFSISAMMYSFAKKHWKKEKIALPKLTYQQYQKVREASYGGRTDTFDAAGKTITEEVVGLDMVSMYAYEMLVADNRYPSGEIETIVVTDELVESLLQQYEQNGQFDRIGIYPVNIDQISLVHVGNPMIIPLRKEKGNNWETKGNVIRQMNLMLCTIDIEQLLKHGAEVHFITHAEAYVFTETIPGYTLFSFLAEFMKLKNECDEAIAKGTAASNAKGLRTLCKFASNSLSGKCMQKVFTTVVAQVNVHAYYSEIALLKDVVEDSIELLGMTNHHTCILRYRKMANTIKNIKNAYLTMCIYAYARRDIYRVLKRVPMTERIMVDTDSCKCTKAIYDRYLKAYLLDTTVPHNEDILAIDERYADAKMLRLNSNKVYGSFVHELSTNNLTIVAGKKSYGIFNIIDNVPTIVKISLRGVKPASVIVFNEESVSHFIMTSLEDNEISYFIHDKEAALDYVLQHKDDTIQNPVIAHKLFAAMVEGNFVVSIGFFINRFIAETRLEALFRVTRLYINNQEVEEDEEPVYD